MSVEKYQLSPEEIKKAEDMMTDEERKLSESREEGYKIAKAEGVDLAKPTIEKLGDDYFRVHAPERPYDEDAVVNGVEIGAHWDDGYHDYVIYFPQIELGEAAAEKGVHDQVIRVSRNPEAAKKAFTRASELAKAGKSAYEIYKEIEEFCKELPEE